MSSVWKGSRLTMQGSDVVGEIAGDGELAAVEGGVAEAVDAFVGFDLERDEVAARGADVDGGARDLHRCVFPFCVRLRGLRGLSVPVSSRPMNAA